MTHASPPTPTASPAIVHRAPISSWGSLLRTSSLSADQRRAREQLSLPTDRAVVMTGHQAEFWHMGVLAKYLALAAFAKTNAPIHASWLVVDHDANEPWNIAYPALPTADVPRITRARWTIPLTGAGRTGFAPDTPTVSLPPLSPLADAPHIAGPRPDALAIIAKALRATSSQPTAAHQLTAATAALLHPTISPDSTLFASRLAETDLFAAWLERIAKNPAACVSAYNAATTLFPAAKVRPLELTDARVELPLWRLRFGAPRRRVFAHELATIPTRELAPRALFMTALIRAACCNLFIHGLGGEKYEAITEAWINAWAPDTRLAPMAVVSATRTLDFSTTPGLAPDALRVPTPESIAHQVWLAHRAAHDPALLGDPRLATEKSSLHAAIATAPRRTKSRAELYRTLLSTEQAAIAAHPDRLAEYRAAAHAARARRHDADILFDRTWAFPMHAPETVQSLLRDFEP